MLMKVDASWLMMAVATVSMLSYMISLGFDALMKGDGFGPIGNAILITGGFFLSIYVGNMQGLRFESVSEASMVGIGGAFGILLVLTLAKAALDRM
jgi:hypothetical protein